MLHVCCHSFLERDKSYEIHFAATSKAVARTRELTAAQGKAAQPLTNLPYNGVYFAIIHEPKNMKLVFKRFYDLGADALNANTSIHIAPENAWQKEKTLQKTKHLGSAVGRHLPYEEGRCHARPPRSHLPPGRCWRWQRPLSHCMMRSCSCTWTWIPERAAGCSVEWRFLSAFGARG